MYGFIPSIFCCFIHVTSMACFLSFLFKNYFNGHNLGTSQGKKINLGEDCNSGTMDDTCG